MPHINLLPWREASRREQKKQYLSILMLVAILAFGVMFFISLIYGALKDGQGTKNQFLQAEVTLLDQRIAEIRELDKKKASLQQRMRLIEELQSNRNLGTQILDEIAKVVPSGVYLTKLERRDNQIEVVGKSESNNRVSSMLRHLQESYLLEKPTMRDIVAGEKQPKLLSDFNMQFSVKPFENIEGAKK